jgi:tRNA:m4X modification enzyme
MPEFQTLHSIIAEIYQSLGMDELEGSIKTHEALDERMKETHNGKHASQQSSLLGNLSELNLLKQESSFVEFGCGAGEFTRYIFNAIKPSHCLLIDRNRTKLKVAGSNIRLERKSRLGTRGRRQSLISRI